MTEHEAQEGVNRRHLFQAAAAGASGFPAASSPPRRSGSNRLPRRQPLPQPQIMHLPNLLGQRRGGRFVPVPHLDMRTSGAVIRLRHGGYGPPFCCCTAIPKIMSLGTRSRRVLQKTITSYCRICAATATARFRAGSEPHQLQFPRHGTGYGGGDGAAWPSPVFSGGAFAVVAPRTVCASITRSG